MPHPRNRKKQPEAPTTIIMTRQYACLLCNQDHPTEISVPVNMTFRQVMYQHLYFIHKLRKWTIDKVLIAGEVKQEEITHEHGTTTRKRQRFSLPDGTEWLIVTLTESTPNAQS